MAAEFQVSPFGRNITTRMKTDLHRPITGVGARWRMSSRRRPASFRLRLAAESLGREPRGCERHAVVPKTGRSIRSRSFGAPRIFVAGGLGRASHPAAQFPRPLLGRPLSTPHLGRWGDSPSVAPTFGKFQTTTCLCSRPESHRLPFDLPGRRVVFSTWSIEPIAQIPAQNFSVSVLRKLGDKFYPLWLLEAPKMLPAERDQCIRIDVGISFAQHDCRRDVFSPFRVGEAVTRHLTSRI
jgi:hypothetical protein